MDIQAIMDSIQQFGFPIVVAIWALWRLDRSWSRGEGSQARLDQIEEGIDRVELTMDKSNSIQHEMLITLKILETIVTTTSNKSGGGDR